MKIKKLKGPILWREETVRLFKEIETDLVSGESVLLNIQSSGGQIGLVEQFYNKVRGFSNFYTYVSNFASSSAAILFLLGRKRVMHPDAILIFHGTTLSASEFLGKALEDRREDVEEAKRHHIFCEEVIVERSQLLFEEEVRSFMRDKEGEGRRVFRAKEAFGVGLATEIAVL